MKIQIGDRILQRESAQHQLGETRMSMIRFTTAATAAIATALVLAGCSITTGSIYNMEGMDHSGDSAPSSSSGEANTGAHNDADIAFAMGMVPHHQQAVEMADMILGKNGIDQQVISLAERIKAAQGPEITLMKGWLDTWGSQHESMGDMPGMDMGTGMMSEQDMARLDSATGVEASRLFLTQMIEHHNGAIEMANVQAVGGTNPDAKDLAKNIIKSQTAEIKEMQMILASL